MQFSLGQAVKGMDLLINLDKFSPLTFIAPDFYKVK